MTNNSLPSPLPEVTTSKGEGDEGANKLSVPPAPTARVVEGGEIIAIGAPAWKVNPSEPRLPSIAASVVGGLVKSSGAPAKDTLIYSRTDGLKSLK